MEISEIRIKLIPNPTDRLKGFASVTLDGDFVVRDIKIIDGASGVFVAMPSRKLADRCPHCGTKNHVRAKYCNECGKALPKERIPRDKLGRDRFHADIAHPINTECRQQLQQRIVEAYTRDLKAAGQPGYRSPAVEEEAYEDVDEVMDPGLDDAVQQEPPSDDSGDYDSLIKDLKHDAAQRREAHTPPAPPAVDQPESMPVEEPPRRVPGPISSPDPASGGLSVETPDGKPSSGPGGDRDRPDDFGLGID